MQIIHTPADGIFGSKDTVTLKKEIEDYYSYKGCKPDVRIEGNIVVVTINDDKILKAEEDFHTATQLAEKGKTKEAEAKLNEIIKVLPEYSEAYRLLAQFKMLEGKYEEATDINIEALKNNPSNKWALLLMGNLLYKTDLDSALTYFEKAHGIDPDNAVVTNNIATIFATRKQFGKAIDMFDKALAANPAYVPSYIGKAKCFLEQQLYEEAFEAARIGVLNAKDSPEVPNGRKNLISLLVHCAEKVSEITNYESVIACMTEGIESMNGRKVELVEDNSLGVFAKAEYGPFRNRKNHTIRYRNDNLSYHLIVHELTHLLIFEEEEKTSGIKKMFSTFQDSENFRKAVLPLMSKLEKAIGRDGVRELV